MLPKIIVFLTVKGKRLLTYMIHQFIYSITSSLSQLITFPKLFVPESVALSVPSHFIYITSNFESILVCVYMFNYPINYTEYLITLNHHTTRNHYTMSVPVSSSGLCEGDNFFLHRFMDLVYSRSNRFS